MKARTKLYSSMMAAAFFLLGEVALAAPKALIDMSSGSPAPALAKSWSKVKDGEYTFELDTTQEVKKGQAVSPALVKDALEGKLGSSLGVKVTEKGASSVSVTYTGDEKKFLEQVGKTKIRGKGGDSELAMEDSVSEGGIRAKPADRDPVDGEVKATILKIGKDTITAEVLDSKAKGVAKKDTVKIKGKVKGAKAGELVFFVPEKNEKGTVTAKKGSLK